MAETTKKELRAEIRWLRSDLTNEYLAEASARIQEAVMNSSAFAQSRTVFIYVSVPGEPATDALIKAALAAGKRVCVPRCRKAPEMDAVQIQSPGQLKPGTMNIPEPEEGLPCVAPEEIDLAVVPCVSATTDGARLGHGGGYYDWFLSRTPALRMCLCFHALLSKTIPVQAHDLRMDCVVTEQGFAMPIK